MFLKYFESLEFPTDAVVEVAKCDKKYTAYEEVPEELEEGVIEGIQAFKML